MLRFFLPNVTLYKIIQFKQEKIKKRFVKDGFIKTGLIANGTNGVHCSWWRFCKAF